MLVKTILIFLLSMALIGMIGRAIFGASGENKFHPKIVKPSRCRKCGRWKFGQTGCECER